MANSFHKYLYSILGLLLFIFFGFLVKVNYLDRPTLITVVGEGKVKVTPTMVKFTITISNLSPSATQAINENNNIVKNLVNILKNNGVLENDIDLAYVRIIPPQTSLGQTSFQAVNSANITLKNISKFDSLVFLLYGNGAQSVSNILFTTENSKDLEKEAVAQAINEAKTRAEELAKAAGKSLGRMVSIATVEVGEAGALSGEAGKPDFGGVTTSSPSQIEITRQASIVFELR